MYGKHNYICTCIVEAQANLLNTLERKFRRIYVFILYQIKNKDRNSILNNPIRHVTHFQSTLVRSLSLSLGAPKCPEGSHPWLLSAYTILEQEKTHTHCQLENKNSYRLFIAVEYSTLLALSQTPSFLCHYHR